MDGLRLVNLKRPFWVKILRSTGQTQSTTIKHIKFESGSVSVQWSEKGRQRIKVLSFAALIHLNPNLFFHNGKLYERLKVDHTINSGRIKENHVENSYYDITTLGSDLLDNSDILPKSIAEKTNTLHRRQEHRSQNCDVNNDTNLKKMSNISRHDSPSPRQIDKTAGNFSVPRKGTSRSAAASLSCERTVLTSPRASKTNLELDHEVVSSASGAPVIDFPRLTVCVRKRPISVKEGLDNDFDIVEMPHSGHVVINEPRHRLDLTEFMESQTFRFDHTFNQSKSTREVYELTAAPLVQDMFRGSMATCFAYGQTGSGKTFTMSGPIDSHNGNPVLTKGLYGMVVSDIFKTLADHEQSSSFCVTVGFFEIYCNRVYDLLNEKNMIRVLEDSTGAVQLVGLSEILVRTVNETLGLLKQSSQLRTSGTTSANANSSRSHAIFQVNLRKIPSAGWLNKSGSHGDASKQSEQRSIPDIRIEIFQRSNLVGRFSLIDLAGNERGADMMRDGDRTALIECGEINKSLLALKECIRAMGRRNHSHLPFRNSKLTQVLRESFVGVRSRTCMIAMVAPSLSCFEHTLNTLRYAHRVKQLIPLECWQRYGEMGYSHAIKGKMRTVVQPPAMIIVRNITSGDGRQTSGHIPSRNQKLTLLNNKPGSKIAVSSTTVGRQSCRSNAAIYNDDDDDDDDDDDENVSLNRVGVEHSVSHYEINSGTDYAHCILSTVVGNSITSDRTQSDWKNNGIFCDQHCDRSRKSIKAREKLSELAIRHDSLLQALPKWFYLHRRILKNSCPDPECMKEYTESIIELTSKQIKKLTNLKNTAIIYHEMAIKDKS